MSRPDCARSYWAILLAVWSAMFLAAAGGCGSSDAQPSAETAQSEGPSAAETPATAVIESDGRQPAEVVRIFLEGMQQGDQALVDSMLTAKARELDHFKVEPRQDHRFAVGETEMVGDEGARVASAWFFTAESPQGTPEEQTQKFIWVLRREPEGFRICGTFMILAELGNKAVSLDFENLEQMRQTEQQVQEEMIAAYERENGGTGNGAARVAENPGDSAAPQ